MPLKKWVTLVAPASVPAVACSTVAAECPSDTTTPRPTSERSTSKRLDLGSEGDRRDAGGPGPVGRLLERRWPQQRSPVGATERRQLGTGPPGGARSAPPAPPGGRAGGQRREGGIDAPLAAVTTVGSQAVTPQRSRRRTLPGAGWARGDVDAEAAVALEVDEAGRHQEPGGVDRR